MKTVCICGSFRFYEEMLDLSSALYARGVSCEWPVPGTRRDPRSMTPDEAGAAIALHFERMDRADLILVWNKNGYTGNSVIMEIGYAHARGKPIYALAPIPDQFLMSLVTAVVSIEEFMKLAQT